LRDYRLLTPALFDALDRESATRSWADYQALATELIRRGWLTPYQVELLTGGRVHDLLVGHYIVLDRLGEGGAGQVFKARHQTMERLAALKIVRRELLANAEMVRRFYREIEAVSQLSHTNIVHAYDAGPVGMTHFLAMEYLEGIDLSRLVKQGGPLSVDEAREYIREAAVGLQYIHEHGMVHRDIKPSNLMLCGSVGEWKSDSAPALGHSHSRTLSHSHVKILDLGLARLQQRATGELATTITGSNTTMMGTVDYMAPEQAIDSHTVDIRADIYSLGCTLFYLLTGQPPFPGGTEAEKLVKHQMKLPPDVRELRPEVPEDLMAILSKMVAKEPGQRFQTATELLQVLCGEISVTALGAGSEPLPIAIPVALTSTSQTATRGMPTATQVLDSTPGEHTAHIARKRARRTILAIGGAFLLGGLTVLVLSGRRSSEGTAKITQPATIAKKEPPLFEDKFAGRELSPQWKLSDYSPWKVVPAPPPDVKGYVLEGTRLDGRDNGRVSRALRCGEWDWSDYAVEVSVRWRFALAPPQTPEEAILLARLGNSGECYQMEYRVVPPSVRILTEKTDAAPLDETKDVPTPESGKWYRLRFEAEGPKLRAFINGIKVAEVPKAPRLHGRAGITRGMYGGETDAPLMWKDFRVEKLPASSR
jgi:serine/threonine-protein kinase